MARNAEQWTRDNYDVKKVGVEESVVWKESDVIVDDRVLGHTIVHTKLPDFLNLARSDIEDTGLSDKQVKDKLSNKGITT